MKKGAEAPIHTGAVAFQAFAIWPFAEAARR